MFFPFWTNLEGEEGEDKSNGVSTGPPSLPPPPPPPPPLNLSEEDWVDKIFKDYGETDSSVSSMSFEKQEDVDSDGGEEEEEKVQEETSGEEEEEAKIEETSGEEEEAKIVETSGEEEEAKDDSKDEGLYCALGGGLRYEAKAILASHH